MSAGVMYTYEELRAAVANAERDTIATVRAQIERVAQGHDDIANRASGLNDGSEERAKAKALRRFAEAFLR